MTDNKSSRALHIATTFLILICLAAASQWCMNRFVLYDAQNRVLQPADYTVSVTPVASGAPGDARLSDDGRFAVKVMTVGTSHAMDRVTHALLPVFSLGLIGLAATWYVARRRDPQPA